MSDVNKHLFRRYHSIQYNLPLIYSLYIYVLKWLDPKSENFHELQNHVPYKEVIHLENIITYQIMIITRSKDLT
jgi:hypothetical protein